MTVAEGTRSRSNTAETEGTGLMLQEILRKLESFGSRLAIMESISKDKVARIYPSMRKKVKSEKVRSEGWIITQTGSLGKLRTKFYQKFYGAFDDQSAAMEAILLGK